MNTTVRPNLRICATRKQWAVIISTIVLLHAAFLLFFKSDYLRVFKTEAPPEKEGEPRSPYLDNPFHVIALTSEYSVASPVSEEAAEKRESISEVLDETAVGEPQDELQPLSGARSGSRGSFGSRHATVEPKPLFMPWPKYPVGIRNIPQGRVELMLLVNERGEVADITVSKELPVPELNRIAVDAARKIRFTPGMTRGVRSAMWVRLAIGFQPR
jgi:TonB family protein